MTTLFGRAAPRDYLDVNAALASGQYSGDRLLELASEHDAGFDPCYFAQALRAIDRWPDRKCATYGVDGGHVEDMRRRLSAWAAEILDERIDERCPSRPWRQLVRVLSPDIGASPHEQEQCGQGSRRVSRI